MSHAANLLDDPVAEVTHRLLLDRAAVGLRGADLLEIVRQAIERPPVVLVLLVTIRADKPLLLGICHVVMARSLLAFGT